MKTQIVVHMLFLKGHHVELLLENPGSIVIHLDNQYSTKSSIKEFHYIWDGTALYQRSRVNFSLSNTDCKIDINDPIRFDQEFQKLIEIQHQSLSDDVIELCLTQEQAQTLITDNGGHTIDSRASSFYSMNRWREPGEHWHINHDATSQDKTKFRNFIALKNKAPERYTFDIMADPEDLTREWNLYHERTKAKAHIFGENCAIATQWFLATYAQVPQPKFWAPPVGINQVMYYLHCPSFVPLFALLPKRVFDNAKFHLEIRKNPVQETFLTINIRLATHALTIFGSLSGIFLASRYLSKGAKCVFAPLLSLVALSRIPHLFSDINQREAKRIGEGNEHALKMNI
ncbi:MAG: hypothetical protein Q8R24_07030 [Legionellaceae bacterium]|nr:hypothetical protein [Legionellaceae bacterium]